MLGATAAVALSATPVALGPAGVAAAAGVDALQVVRVRPSGGTVELLVAVPERYTGVTVPATAFALDGGEGPVAPLSSTPVPAARSTVAVVLDNRAVISPPDLLTAQVAAVELLRGLEDGTPFAVVTTARPAALQGPTTDKDAAGEAIRSVARGGTGSLSDGVSAALAGVSGDAVAPALALFTAGGQGAGPELSAQAAAAGAVLTELDATGVQPAALLPAVDELTGTLTGRQLLTFPAWGTGQATLSLSMDGRSYEAAVDLPPDAATATAAASGSGASQGAPPAEAKAPPKDLRPSQTPAPAPVRPSPSSGSTGSNGSGGDRSRSLLFSIAAALAAIAILGAGLTINRRERRARRRGALRPLGAAADGRPNEAVPRLASGAEAGGSTGSEGRGPARRSCRSHGAAGASRPSRPRRWGRSTTRTSPSRPSPDPTEAQESEPEAQKSEPEAQESEPEPERAEAVAEVAAASVDAPVRRRRGGRRPDRGCAPTAPLGRPGPPVTRRGPALARRPARVVHAWGGHGSHLGRVAVRRGPAGPLGSPRRGATRGAGRAVRRRRAARPRHHGRGRAPWSGAGSPSAARPSAAAPRCPCATPGAASTASGCCRTSASSTGPTCRLWSLRDAPGQLFLTAAAAGVPPGGPALVSTAALPQFNHFNGQRSRVWPLWLDRDGAEANLADDVLPLLEDEIGVAVVRPGPDRLRHRRGRPSGLRRPLRP